MNPKRKPIVRSNAEPTIGDEIQIPLGELLGIDPSNSRRDELTAESVRQMADNIVECGQINPLLVRLAPEGGFYVLAGARRWCALNWINENRFPQTLVRVRVFAGEDEAARVASLSENFQREDLHPLAQAEQIAKLASAETPERLARALGIPVGRIKQNLRLAELPDAAKLAWREGRVDLAGAKALALGEAEAVADLIATRPELLSDPRAIREALKPRGVSPEDRRAVFVGLDAYAKAGGIIHEDLFDDDKWLTDVQLLNRLAKQKLSEWGERLCEVEGWRTIHLEPPGYMEEVEPDYTDQELIELDELELMLARLMLPRADLASPELLKVLDRVDEIRRIGILRAVPQAERYGYDAYVGIDAFGRFDVRRGLISPRSPSPSSRFLPKTAATTTPPRPFPPRSRTRRGTFPPMPPRRRDRGLPREWSPPS